MDLIDTHAHTLDPRFDGDRKQVFERAKEKRIGTIVEIAESPSVWEKAKEMCETPEGKGGIKMVWACGWHPHYADRVDQDNFAIMRDILSSPLCIALGEIGLDYVKSAASKEEQIRLLGKVLEIAVEKNKPVIIHCREAQEDTVAVLKDFFPAKSPPDMPRGVIHCFSGDRRFAESCLELGFYLGVDGPITYPSSRTLREVLSQAPLDRIVLETDCPYLPPQEFRGKRNEPSYLTFAAEKLSELFGRSPEEIARVTTENAKKLFRLDTVL